MSRYKVLGYYRGPRPEPWLLPDISSLSIEADTLEECTSKVAEVEDKTGVRPRLGSGTMPLCLLDQEDSSDYNLRIYHPIEKKLV